MFYDFTSFFKVFINIYEYANYVIYMSDYKRKGMRLIFNSTPSFRVFYDK